MNASIKYLLENDTLLIGISELSQMSEVSPRQLRYWEQKGFIKSVVKEGNAARQYRLPTVVKVEIIKGFIDEGFTLSKAVEKAEEKIENIRELRSLIKEAVTSIDFEDEKMIHVTLGNFEPDNDNFIISFDKETKKMTYQIKK